MEASLGDQLRNARKSSGISVDDAVYLAKFPRAVVEALEAENFGFFTSPLYARSFLRQYSDYVGADVDDWIDSLVPAPMIGSEVAESVIDTLGLDEHVEMKKASITTSGNRLAAVWMIAITAGLIWGGMIIYEKLDSQLSDASLPPSDLIQPSSTDSKTIADMETTPENEAEKVSTTPENVPEGPKRAIIVNIPEE